MIDYHRFCQIKYLHAHQGLNASQIAREVSLDPRTVAYWLAQEHFRPRKPTHRASKLDPFRGYIEYYLSEDPFVSTAVIYQRLLQRGFSGSPRRIKDFLRERHAYACVQTQLIKYPFPLESAVQEHARRLATSGYSSWSKDREAKRNCQNGLQENCLANISINSMTLF
jgi:hypothetical protein